MSNAINGVSEPERIVETGIAKTRKAAERRGGGDRTDVTAPAAPDERGQLVDREA